MSKEIKIIIPQLNANDTEVYLGAFQVKSGAFIHEGKLIAEIETTKGTEEIVSPSEGYFYPLAKESQNYSVGDCIAIIASELRDTIDIDIAPAPKSPVNDNSGVILTAKARKLAKELGIIEEDLPRNILLKENDIKEYAKKMNIKNGDTSAKIHDRLENALIKAKDYDNPILIVGAGTTAKITIETILAAGDYQIAGIVDGNADNIDNVLGVPVIGYDDAETLEKIFHAGILNACNSVLSFYNLKVREAVFKKLKQTGFNLPAIIHPRAFVESSAMLGEGVFVHSNAYIGSECKIGANSFINTSAVISHDCIMGDTVFCAPNSVIAGVVSIGDYCVIGMCATILSGVKIGSNAFIANGTNVIADVRDNARLNPSTKTTG